MVKKKMKCPICERRVFDISTQTDERVEIELKCPNCKRIVNVSCTEAAEIKELKN